MDAGTFPIKTAAGQAELSTRERRLSQRHRTVLFLVDGKHSESQVRAMAARAGVSAQCFDDLLAEGLIEFPRAVAPPVAAIEPPAPLLIRVPPLAPSLQPAPTPALPKAAQQVPHLATPPTPKPALPPAPEPAPAPAPAPPPAQLVLRSLPAQPTQPAQRLPPRREMELPQSVLDSMRADLDAFLPPPSAFESKFDSRIDSRFDSRIDSRIDSRMDSKIDSRVDESRVGEVWGFSQVGDLESSDTVLEEARTFLMARVRSSAPVVAGSLTLRRLREVSTRAELLEMLDEVQARITRPNRARAAAETIDRVRDLLEGRVDSLPPA